MLLRRFAYSPYVGSLRRYAILKNTVVQNTKKRVPRQTFDKFPPTGGAFDAIDPVREGPDWSYCDQSRVTPLTPVQLAHHQHQRYLAEKVVQFLKELKDAETDFQESREIERRDREQSAKLRPKAKGSKLAVS